MSAALPPSSRLAFHCPDPVVPSSQIGGCEWGGYVNSDNQNNPTYEFFPSRGAPVTLNVLLKTLPANLFSLTWLLPSGNLFIQTNWATEIFDYKNNIECACWLP